MLKLTQGKVVWVQFQEGKEVFFLGRAIGQAVSRWLPIATVRVRDRVTSGDICGEQSGTGAGFIRILRFPLPIFSPPIAPQPSSSIVWG
jgi:hypothetical protein